jgi:hypothetical protein
MVPPPVRSSLLLRCLAFTSVVAFVLCAYACGSGNTTGITPLTGIVVRADDLAAGYGCGTGPNQIYEYAVIVSTFQEGGAGAVFIAGGYAPCYADATYINLCASTSGSLAFNVQVFAFTEAQWNLKSPQLLSPPPGPLYDLESYCQFDGGSQAAFNADVNLENLSSLYETNASFTASCVATQQENIEVVAVCSTLTPVPPPATPQVGALRP